MDIGTTARANGRSNILVAFREQSAETKLRVFWIILQIFALLVFIFAMVSYTKSFKGFNGALTILQLSVLIHGFLSFFELFCDNIKNRQHFNVQRTHQFFIGATFFMIPLVLIFGFYSLLLTVFVWLYAVALLMLGLLMVYLTDDRMNAYRSNSSNRRQSELSHKPMNFDVENSTVVHDQKNVEHPNQTRQTYNDSQIQRQNGQSEGVVVVSKTTQQTRPNLDNSATLNSLDLNKSSTMADDVVIVDQMGDGSNKFEEQGSMRENQTYAAAGDDQSL